MTTAEILSSINSIANADYTSSMTRVALTVLAEKVADKVRAEAAANTGRAGVVAALARMLKHAGKSRAALGGAWIDDTGRQCMTDGFRAYRLNKPLPLPPLPKEYADRPLDLAKIINPPKMLQGVSLPVPDCKRLKTFIQLERAAHGGNKRISGEWSFGDGQPTVDAIYLLELLEVFPDVRLYSIGIHHPIYAVSADGDGILMPIRRSMSDINPQTMLTTARNRSTDATPDFSLYEFAAWRRAMS